MKTITNISNVTDNSGEPPIVTYSNPVATVIRKPPPKPKITRIYYRLPCCCRNCRYGCCGCICNCMRNCTCNR